LVSSSSPGSVSGLRTQVSDFLVPAVYAISKPFNDIADNIRDISGLADLQATNKRLMAENARLKEWYQTALRLEAENKSLKKLLNLKTTGNHKYITSTVMMDTGRSFVKSILVDATEHDGVKKNQAVISGSGLIGRIIDVGEKTSRILLLTDINSRIPILVENSNQHAILAGDNDSLPKLVHLPKDSNVKDGALIITSGYGGVFPKGLPIGQVVMSDKGTPLVRPFEDLDGVTYIKIIQTPNKKDVINKVEQ
ncbi:MAG: rod shape-determining protein MreC, partial [Pseudomonadota bacterium]